MVRLGCTGPPWFSWDDKQKRSEEARWSTCAGLQLSCLTSYRDIVEIPTVVLLCLFQGLVAGLLRPRPFLKGTQDWEFSWLRFWNLRYFFVSYVKILIFYKKILLIGPLLGEVRFFRVVLGLRGMKKNFEVGKKFYFYFLPLWTLNMTQY